MVRTDQQSARDATWCEYRVHWSKGRVANQSVLCVSRKVSRGVWEPWVFVARSALLDRVGVLGYGLYAARRFRKGDVIGRFDGTVVNTFNSREQAMRSPIARRMVQGGKNMIITRQAQPRGVELLNGSTGGAPYLQYANDPRGTGLQPNANVTPGGYMTVSQTSIQAFDLDKRLHENIGSEIRWSYGDDYWALFNILGTHRMPIIVG